MNIFSVVCVILICFYMPLILESRVILLEGVGVNSNENYGIYNFLKSVARCKVAV